jgi:outer membrane immunogenic protein
LKDFVMRKFATLAVVASALIAAPAYASGEARVEARGGIAFAGGNSEAFVGVAAGYDFDLGDSGFVGLEGSADKLLVGGSDVLFGVAARGGAKVGEKGKAYVLGGYGFTKDASDPFIGAGYQHKIGSKVYGKLEYRMILNQGSNINFAGVGIGAAF